MSNKHKAKEPTLREIRDAEVQRLACHGPYAQNSHPRGFTYPEYEAAVIEEIEQSSSVIKYFLRP